MPVSLKKLPKKDYIVTLGVENQAVQMTVLIPVTGQTKESAADTAVVFIRGLLTDVKNDKYPFIYIEEVADF